VFFAHATGFHARIWDQVVENLPCVHCWALDMRGHGRSEKPEPPYSWRLFAEDVAEVARQIGLRGAVGVGHSKGGWAVTMAAGLDPGTFGSLLLVDPVVLPRAAYQAMAGGGEHYAARRRDRWSSPEEMLERFAGRAPFDTWNGQVLRDYVEYGLLPAPDGEGFVLACPPAVEAATYAGSRAGEEIYDVIPTLEIPVRVLRARPRTEASARDMSSSPTWPGLAGVFRHGVDVPAPQYSHYMPMEDPAFIARQVRELVAGNPAPAPGV
jgi:pimeloyl-ACP methyl ester carboxylesterase